MNDANENHATSHIDDLHDRLLDTALVELAGGKTPPDLSARITTAFEASRLSPALQPTSARRGHPARWFAAAIAAMLLVGLAVLLLPGNVQHREAVRSFARADHAGNSKPGASPPAQSPSEAASQSVGTKNQGFRLEAAPGLREYRYFESFGVDTPSNRPEGASASPVVSTPKRAPTNAEREKLRQLETAAALSQESGGPESRARDAADKETTRLVHEIQDRQSQGQSTDKLLAELKRRVEKSVDPERLRALAANGNRDELRAILAESDPSLWPDGAKTIDGIGPGSSGDRYVPITENPFIKAEGGAAVSTFSIDVDTASYTNVRQFLLEMNQLPPPDAVRIEELVNYFHYDYAPPANSAAKPPAEPGADKEADAANTPAAPGHGSAGADSAGGPTDEAPFAAHVEVAGCPWNTEHRLARIAVKGREMDRAKRPPSNLVFLVDVSGSMNEPAKLPLVVYGLQQLTKELGENDHIAIVVYAGSEGLALPSTSGSKQDTILAVLQKLQAGGSTAGGAGIQLAYKIAEDSFIKGGTNRVILCTDGDFNVGVTSTAELQRMVEQKAKDTGVFLSVLGFGRGNLNDAMMEAIADHGNGNYHYVDNRTEARRVLVEEMSGTLVTIAKDVKIQVEFNPAQVAAYRLIGYENRMLRTEDFNDDKKDAGEIGAGHTVTALYEVVPAGKNAGIPPVDDLKYQKPSGWLGSSAASPQTRDVPEGSATPRPQPPNASLEDTANDRTDRYVRPTDDAASNELLTLKMRYKAPDGDTSKKLEWPVTDKGESFAAASDDFQFAAAVAGFGLLLRDSQYKGNLSFAADLELAQSGLGPDDGGYRAEFLDMVRAATKLKGE